MLNESDVLQALSEGQNVMVNGVAGAGKSSLLLNLYKYNFTSPIVLTQTNQLKQSHLIRFSEVKGMQVETYSSALETVNIMTEEYESILSPLKFNADIIIMDECFTCSSLQQIAVSNASKALGAPILMIGDFMQSSFYGDNNLSKYIHYIDFNITSSLRGDETNRRFIEYLRELCSVKPNVTGKNIYNICKKFNIKVSTEIIFEENTTYGYIENSIARTIASHPKFVSERKIFTGKIRYKANGDYPKKYIEAPVVTQDIKTIIKAFTARDTVVASPKNLISHITAQGREVTDSYNVVFADDTRCDTKDFYTLMSRHSHGLEYITVTFLKRKNCLKKLFPKISSISLNDAPINTIPYESVLQVGTEFVGSSPGDTVYLSEVEFLDKLKSSGKEYSESVRTIKYINDVIVKPDTLKAWDDNRDKEPPSRMQSIMEILLTNAPYLLCDTTMFSVNDTYKYIDIRKYIDVPFDKFDSVPLWEDSSVDIKASYYQCFLEYSKFIGYGEVTREKRNKDDIYYSIYQIGDTRFLSNNVTHDFFVPNADEITRIAYRNSTLDTVMTDKLKQQIYYSRYVKYTKDQCNIWGRYFTPRFVIQQSKIHKGMIAFDIGIKSALMLFMADIKNVQNGLMHMMYVKNNMKGYYRADCFSGIDNIQLLNPDIMFDCSMADSGGKINIAPKAANALYSIYKDNITALKGDNINVKITKAKREEVLNKAQDLDVFSIYPKIGGM